MKAELKGELVLEMFGNVICTDLGSIGLCRVAMNILNKRARVGNLSTIDNRGYPLFRNHLIIITISSRKHIRQIKIMGLPVVFPQSPEIEVGRQPMQALSGSVGAP